MKVNIYYCQQWNYKPAAASLADELRNAFGIEAKLVAGSNGIFDVIIDDKLAFSKGETGRFPKQGEIVQKLRF